MKKKFCVNFSLRCVAGLAILLSLLLLLVPAVSADTFCPCDDLDTCTEWVSEGSLSLQWGRTGQMEVAGVKYTFRADDFDPKTKSALISAEKQGSVRKEFLFLELQDSDKWFHWDNEIKVELTGISVDSYNTPSAQLQIYSRGRPGLEISFAASSEKIKGVDVSREQYAPGQEKKVEVTVKNTGDAWAENIILKVDLGEFKLKGNGDFEYRDNIIVKNLGCLEKGKQQSINFTVIAPQWDGRTSPYELNYYINAAAVGTDIKKGYYDTSAATVFRCTEPELKVILKVVGDEINMTTWSVRQNGGNTDGSRNVYYEIWDAWEYSFLRTNIYNLGLYPVDNVDVTFADIPEELITVETFVHGDYSYVTPDGQYYIARKLVPLRQGRYSFSPVTAKADFFGKEFTWSSGTGSITVHGAHVIMEKKLSPSDSGYRVTLIIKNSGDRAAWVNLSDVIPESANYVAGSAEESLAASEFPLSEWDMGVSQVNGSQMLSVSGVLLPPGTSLELGYSIEPAIAPDLPAARAAFKAIDGYRGEAQSSFFVAGVEVKQRWDPLNGGWVVVIDETPESPVAVDDDTFYEPLYSTEDVYALESVYSTEVQQETVNSSMADWLPDPFSATVLKVQELLHRLLGGTIEGVSAAFGTIEGVAIDAVENYLYAIVILIALGVFMAVYVLISR